MTPLVDLIIFCLAFLRGSTSKPFHRRIVSSPATVAMEEQSGLMVKLRTLSSWPKYKIMMFRPAESMKYNKSSSLNRYLKSKLHVKYRDHRVKMWLTIELCNPGERGVLPDNNIVVDIAMGRDQLLVVGCKHHWWDLKSKVCHLRKNKAIS